MGTAPSHTILDAIDRGQGRMLCRAIRNVDHGSVILKVLDPRLCQPKALERLKSEYELGRMLDTRAVVKPLALDAYQGMPALVMEDFGGQSLDQFLGAAMDVELFLRVAVEIASGVAEIHQRDVIHRDRGSDERPAQPRDDDVPLPPPPRSG
ncbi:MAG: protein kinase [Myxococcota bacterium]